jgi:hypothetical protein
MAFRPVFLKTLFCFQQEIGLHGKLIKMHVLFHGRAQRTSRGMCRKHRSHFRLFWYINYLVKSGILMGRFNIFRKLGKSDMFCVKFGRKFGALVYTWVDFIFSSGTSLPKPNLSNPRPPGPEDARDLILLNIT